MNEHGNDKRNLNWLLDDVVDRVVGAEGIVLLSADGLLMARSKSMSKDDSDQLSALASGLQSIGRGLSKQFEQGQVVLNYIEMERGFLFVFAAGQGACLAMLANRDVDVSDTAYEMNRLVKRVGEFMTAASRNAGQLT